MTTEKDPHKSGEDCAAAGNPGKKAEGSPAWTDGLKQLYDSVVDEPLPDAFKDLLAQFDESDEDKGGADAKKGSSPGNGKTA